MQPGQIDIGDVTGIAFAVAAAGDDRTCHGGEQVVAVFKAGELLLVAVQRDLRTTVVAGFDDRLHLIERIGDLAQGGWTPLQRRRLRTLTGLDAVDQNRRIQRGDTLTRLLRGAAEHQ